MTAPRARLLAPLFVLLVALLGRPAHADSKPPPQPEPATEQPAAPAGDDDDATTDAPTPPAVEHDFDQAFEGVSHDVSDADNAPAMTPEQLRTIVRAARAKVLPALEAKIERSADKKMATIGMWIERISLLGLLLLAMPLVLRGKYPGKGAVLFKYSVIAAFAFVIAVNLFGLVALSFRTAQAAMAKQTNPQLKLAEGFFDSIDKNADELAPFGSQLFGPTLYQLQNSDEQPTAVLLQNGKQLIEDARVFVAIGKMVKSLDFAFALLPIVLLALAMALFVKAIWPTLREIISLPAAAASGTANARDVLHNTVRTIGRELLVALCTLGVLFVLTLVTGAILGYVVQPAVYSLIEFFGTAIIYLQVQPGASSGLVFVSLFGVILFLVANIAVIVVAVSTFLGKAQKVFQRRFHDRVPLAHHRALWIRGSLAVLATQLVPLAFMFASSWLLEKIESHLASGASDPTDIPWAAVMLVGPAFLLLGFTLVMWASRTFKALGFLMKYKVAAG
jgi:hypothetical protein